jgi:two-component system, chemotaxis family, protein-glutamate methylesterase/glutaminase
MRGLEETTLLLNQISDHFKKEGLKDAASIFARKADMTTKKARVIHDSVFKQEILSEDLRHSKRKANKKTKEVSKKRG